MFPLFFTETAGTESLHPRRTLLPDPSDAFELVFAALIEAETDARAVTGETSPLDASSPEPDQPTDNPDETDPRDDPSAHLIPRDAGPVAQSLTTAQVERIVNQPPPPVEVTSDGQVARLILQKMSGQAHVFMNGNPQPDAVSAAGDASEGRVPGGADPVEPVDEAVEAELPDRRAERPEERLTASGMLTLAWTNERPGPEIQARAEVLGHDPVQHKIVPDAKSHPVQVPEHADIPMKHRPVAVPQPSAATVVSVSAIAPSHGVSDRTPLPLEKIGPAAAASQTTDMSARGDLSTQPAPYGSPERQMIAVPAAEKDDVAARFEALRADRAVPVPTVIAQPKRAVNVAEPVGALTPPLVLQDSKTAMNVLADQDDILIGISPERGQTGQPSALSAQATPDMPRQIAKQLAVAITQHPGRSTEIALNPVELGRVRMNIAAHDGALSLHIMVERPETTDLMRRHIETLTEEFHALGYSDVTFSFSDERSPDPEGDTPAPQQQHFDSRPPPEVSAPIIAVDRRKSGLDLRL